MLSPIIAYARAALLLAATRHCRRTEMALRASRLTREALYPARRENARLDHVDGAVLPSRAPWGLPQ